MYLCLLLLAITLATCTTIHQVPTWRPSTEYKPNLQTPHFNVPSFASVNSGPCTVQHGEHVVPSLVVVHRPGVEISIGKLHPAGALYQTLTSNQVLTAPLSPSRTPTATHFHTPHCHVPSTSLHYHSTTYHHSSPLHLL